MPEAHGDVLSSALPGLVKAVGLEIIIVAGRRMIHEGMMGGENKAAALGEQTVELGEGPRPVRQVMHDKRGEDQIETAIIEGQRLIQINQS